MKFKIQKEVFDKFPNLIVAIPVVLGFDNTKSASEALEFLRSEEKSLKERFTLSSFMEDKKVTPYLKVFQEFGADTTTRLPAHVALSKRILEGGSLPDINPIVNLYNALSIKFVTPFGGEDLASLYGDFVLKFADGTEKWIPIGGGKGKTMFKGDLIWGDDLDISTPSLNWRQCDRTKLIKESKDGYFIMDGFSDVNHDVIQKASEEFSELITKFFGGSVTIYWLSKVSPEVEVPFETKKITEEQLVKPKIEKKVREVVKKEYIGNAKVIVDAIYRAVNSSDGEIKTAINKEEIILDFSSDLQFGDYSTNIAMRGYGTVPTNIVGGKLHRNSSNISGTNPRTFAENIKERLLSDEELRKVVDKIEVAGSGFINFWLKKDLLLSNLMQIDVAKEKYGSSSALKGKKIMFEFAHPNTHKAFHIGHLRNITTGETLSRLHEALGVNVIRANYQGDIGLHIAKALYGIELASFSDPKDIKKRAEYLGKIYSIGATAFEESDEAKEKVGIINKKIYDKSDLKINKLYEETRKWSLDYFEEIYKRVYTKFDRYYFESETVELGKETALKALKDGILIQSEGAIIFEGSKFGLHDRVFISGKGIPTYEAKDLGLAKLQFKEYNPDLLIHTVGPEQIGYFQVIFKALEFIFPPSKGRELHVPYGWVRLKEGKMSSRTGNVILGEKILDDAKENILKNYKNVDNETAEKVAVGAVKYSFLKNGLGQDIAFDLKESISLEGNSGPYIQYTIARTNSVLARSKTKVLQGSTLQCNDEELIILRSLVKFPEVIQNAAQSYSPNLLCNYLYDLASKYNTFYNMDKIIGSENEGFRLALTSATGQVLKNGLKLLGIESPERM